MMGKYLLLTILIFSCFRVQSQTPETGRSNYTMKVQLDSENKTLKGETTLMWYNPSDKEVDELQFHMYYNAFKNTESTFMQNKEEFSFLLSPLKDSCGWSYTDIVSLRDSGDNELITSSRYIAPDDGNKDDQTVLLIPLVTPVAAKDSALYTFTWEAKIPRAMIRTGYNKDYHFFAQWFPKLGVYEPAGMRYEEDGSWSCHQYHANGEYYGEFGNYDVTLEVPSNYVVGASGTLLDKVEEGGRTSWRFAVENVIDFSWTCSPHYIVKEDRWKDVKIQLYTYPGHENFEDRYFSSAINALEYMDKYVGMYPYKTLSLIDPPIHGLFTGGMEYPTFISSVSANFFPKGVRAPETLVVHEFVHQYFMQMIATHEQEEPWMDEGITTYYEGRIMDEYYGEKTSLVRLNNIGIGNKEYNRYQFWAMDNPQIADNSYKAREFEHGGYGTIAYNKTAMMLRTLEGILGKDELDRVMQKYFETWKFNHPCGDDFIDVFLTEVDSSLLKEKMLDLDAFFAQALYGTEICEFGIRDVKINDELWKGGFTEDKEDCELYQIKNNSSMQETRVVVERLGDMIIPVEVEIQFKDGEKDLFLWDGVERTTEIIISDKEVIKVRLDPDLKLELEKNRLNNTWLSRPSKGYRMYTSRLRSGIQHFLDFINFLS